MTELVTGYKRMAKGKKKNSKMLVVCLLLAVVCAMAGALFVVPFGGGDTRRIYVDSDDTVDSLMVKVRDASSLVGYAGFRVLAAVDFVDGKPAKGMYEVKPGASIFDVYNRVKKGRQTPVRLVVPSVRTVHELAGRLSQKLEMDSVSLDKALTDETLCGKYGYDSLSIVALFVPDTYEVYWTEDAGKLLERMKKAYDAFWNADRKAKADRMGLTPMEVTTLASIVEEETSNEAEKPMVAGMYYNRLKKGMRLQADPTVKFALRRFELKRVYRDMLMTDSPFNTYRNAGLPPSPIRIPMQKSIDAVLNYTPSDYIYMCANEDFSGTHRFATTYEEHTANAQRYANALNERGIK